MAKNLVIVESPAKAKTINRILGADYVVKASMGHVRDLPARKFGVDFEKDFEPEYVVVSGRQKVVQELKKTAGTCEAIYLAPDPDREGEAIAWHLSELLKDSVDASHIYRVLYNEITPAAVRAAFGRPTQIDLKKVDSQQARRILDRIVGYKVSPLLWKQVRRGLSAGRVQSVALRLVCEREEQIRKFVPEEFWLLGARVRKQTPPPTEFRIRLSRIGKEKAEVKNAEQAAGLRADLEARRLRVARIATREVAKRPYAPYITSSLQQGASSYCGFSPAKTMRLAQRLYEGVETDEGAHGLITYMRTDSVQLAQSAVAACRDFIQASFGPAYLPEQPNIYKSRGGAQEAHEAIRPTDVTRTPESLAAILGPDEKKLYSLIWRRFVACQMSPARMSQRSVEIEAVAEPPREPDLLFRASASEIVFDGYMKVSGIEKKKEEPGKEEGADEEDEQGQLPPLSEGEHLDCLEWLSERKQTQPPPRYSEASLIRALEEQGVGRPSTYAQILSTLDERGYAAKEKRTLAPTDLGLQVNAFLVRNLDALFDVGFTAKMEAQLDEIEKGSVGRAEMLREFYGKFTAWMGQVQTTEIPAAQALPILELLEKVGQWDPAVQRGKRTFSDKDFAESLGRQAGDGKGLTPRQWQALVRLAYRYRAQVPDLTPLVEQAEREAPAGQSEHALPNEDNIRKLALLANVPLEEAEEGGGRRVGDRAFVESLRRWVDGGRALSPAQARALDRVLVKYAAHIPDFEAMRGELGLAPAGPPDPRQAEAADGVRRMLEQLAGVKDWAPPVQRGRRQWDDRAFFESVRKQFEKRGGLSPKQTASLGKLLHRYRDQIGQH